MQAGLTRTAGARTIRAVLFDLDGTLVDSAPDLFAALAWLRADHGLPALQYQALRHYASRGAMGMIEAGFADQPGLDRELLRERFLEFYAGNLWVHSRPFEGVERALDELREAGLGLAVVTNKMFSLAQPLIRAAGWQDRFGCVVGGDTAARPKPHPAPVLEACRRLAVHPGEALMVGDDARDISAGSRAGSLTAAATWGYVAPGENPSAWAADGLLSDPSELLSIISYFNDL